jgi:diphosphomevalonate decarboxylase
VINQVNSGKKHVGSTDGMQTSVVTSKLLQYRAEHIVPQSLTDMTAAIRERNFENFAELTMKVCGALF